LLDEQPAVRKSIEDRCRGDQPPGTEIRDTAALARLLYESPRQNVIAYLLPSLSQVIGQNDREGVVAVEYLARVWLSLLAAEQGALPPIGGFARDASAPPLRIEAEQPILVDVESKAAEASASEPLLQLAGDHLRSPLDLTPRHNTGLDTSGQRAARDAKDAYALKMRPGMEAFRAEDAKEELERHATRPETGLSRSLLPDDDRARGHAVSEQLHFDRIEHGRSVYIRIPAAGDRADADALRELHRWCPELLVLEVDPIEDPRRRDLLSGLYRIIYRSQQFLSDPGARGAL
jgi:hypothetical protein